MRLGEAAPTRINVLAAELADFVGQPIHVNDRLYMTTPPGVVMGLAWTPMGGSVLFIETTAKTAKAGVVQVIAGRANELVPCCWAGLPSSSAWYSAGSGVGELTLTGQMGDVMRESALIAYTFTRNFLSSLSSSRVNEARQSFDRFLLETSVHLHVPEGATKKVRRLSCLWFVTRCIACGMTPAGWSFGGMHDGHSSGLACPGPAGPAKPGNDRRVVVDGKGDADRRREGEGYRGATRWRHVSSVSGGERPMFRICVFCSIRYFSMCVNECECVSLVFVHSY